MANPLCPPGPLARMLLRTSPGVEPETVKYTVFEEIFAAIAKEEMLMKLIMRAAKKAANFASGNGVRFDISVRCIDD